jgi:hypothetical protein
MAAVHAPSSARPGPRPDEPPFGIPRVAAALETAAPVPSATVQIRPCVFRGSLLASASLYAQPTGGAPIASLDARGVVEVERLELPAARGGRAKVVLRAPIEVEAYLDESAAPLRLDRQIDLVPGHIWLDPGAEARGSSPAGETAEIEVRFGEGASPAALVKRVPCADLSLVRDLPPFFEVPDDRHVFLRAGRIRLHDLAGGREIAAFAGPSREAAGR